MPRGSGHRIWHANKFTMRLAYLVQTKLQFICALYWFAEVPAAGAMVDLETGDHIVTVNKEGTLVNAGTVNSLLWGKGGVLRQSQKRYNYGYE